MCSDQVNMCNQIQCKNGATCHVLVNDFECHCMPGFEGRYCDYTSGQAPSTTHSLRSASRSTGQTRDGDDTTDISRTGQSLQQDDTNVSLTQPQLILIICLSGGIPICLLFILVTILLCRRCRRQVADDKSEEARINEINSMNNRIHNQMVTSCTKSKADLYEYPTTEKKLINDMEPPVPVHQIPLDYKNSAAAQPAASKVVHKDLIKDINRAKEVNLLGSGSTQAGALTVTEQQQYSKAYYQQDRLASIASPTLQSPNRCSSQNTGGNNSTSIDKPISTVCDTVLHKKAIQQIAPTNGNINDHNR